MHTVSQRLPSEGCRVSRSVASRKAVGLPSAGTTAAGTTACLRGCACVSVCARAPFCVHVCRCRWQSKWQSSMSKSEMWSEQDWETHSAPHSGTWATPARTPAPLVRANRVGRVSLHAACMCSKFIRGCVLLELDGCVVLLCKLGSWTPSQFASVNVQNDWCAF